MRKIIAIILFAALITAVLPISLAATNEIIININGINRARGGNETILYNVSGKSTETNEWGYEVVIKNGRVVSVGGNNNTIPDAENSFVVSAHGTDIDVLMAIEVGMAAEYRSQESAVAFFIDINTNRAKIDIARDKCIDAKNLAEEGCYIVDESAYSRFAKVEEKYSSLGEAVSDIQANELIEEYTKISALFREREVAEYRGVWICPTQKNMAEVEHFVRKCVSAGINMISVETIYDCTTICPMPEDSYYSHNPYFEGFDVLGAFVEICKKYGVELHCWMHVYRVSDPASANFSQSVLAKRSDWCLVDQNGSANQSFLNPAIDEAADFLAETYKYILENYEIDALQLDTIRYETASSSIDYGYDITTVSKFKAKYPQYADLNIKYNEQAEYWEDWVQFRADFVSNFLKEIRMLVDEIAPKVILAADVGAVLPSAYATSYQDTRKWLSNGWLDMVIPMAYGDNDFKNVKEFFDYTDNCLVVPALGTYVNGFDAETMLYQTAEMIDLGCAGVAYFSEKEFFEKRCQALLSQTLFTHSALSPLLNGANTAVAILEREKSRLDLAQDRGILDYAQTEQLKKSLLEAISVLKSANTSVALENLTRIIEYTNEIIPQGALQDRIIKDITLANMVATICENDECLDFSPMDNSLPEIENGGLRLDIDKINSSHIGEDSVLITTPAEVNNFNIKYALVLLLKPIDPAKGIYELVEKCQNYGSFGGFSFIEEGMIAVSFHSNDVGEGAERRDAARSLEIGTKLALWGIDVEKEEFTSVNALLYVYKEENKFDINGDETVDMFDYLFVKSVYFEIFTFTDEEFKRCDINDDGEVDLFDYLYIKDLCFE